ncbi:hypothetical protein DY000_02007039 [Brassica cretica]|uniref:Uncharacterized protein n=1 Tax=Brassica cretica TaxID=69181 RepID=A0ABQ7CHK7_BRACR|nr:hypothetical protein DY000_02007039 [Brassica cretica]
MSLISGWEMINSFGGMILRFIRITSLLQEHGNKYVVKSRKQALYWLSNEAMEDYARMRHDRVADKFIGRRINPDWSDMLSFVRERDLLKWIRFSCAYLFKWWFTMFGMKEISEGISKGRMEQNR